MITVKKLNKTPQVRFVMHEYSSLGPALGLLNGTFEVHILQTTLRNCVKIMRKISLTKLKHLNCAAVDT